MNDMTIKGIIFESDVADKMSEEYQRGFMDALTSVHEVIEICKRSSKILGHVGPAFESLRTTIDICCFPGSTAVLCHCNTADHNE